MTKAAVLDTSLQKTHELLHEIERELGFDNERAAYAALSATLHALRDRPPPELVAHFRAELPMLAQGIYYDGWRPSAARLKAAHDEDFFDSIAGELRSRDELEDVEAAAGGALHVNNRRMALGQIDRVFEAMPEKARQAWCAIEQDEDIQ